MVCVFVWCVGVCVCVEMREIGRVCWCVCSYFPLQIYSQEVTLRSPLARTGRGQLQTGSNSAACNAPEGPVSLIREKNRTETHVPASPAAHGASHDPTPPDRTERERERGSPTHDYICV